MGSSAVIATSSRRGARWILGLVLAASVGAGCTSNETASRYSKADIEYQLAVVAGETPTDSNVQKYGDALDAAVPVCQESRSSIADMIVAGKQQGTSMSMLELLRAVPVSVPTEIRPTKCADIIAALIVLGN